MTPNLTIEKYALTYKPTRTGEVSFLLIPVKHKNDKAIIYPYRLLYVVKDKNTFLYVGEAKSALKTRFHRSFASYRHYKRVGKARGGYKGYKWIELLDPEKNTPVNLDIYAVLFPSSFNDYRNRIEAIEGEIVWEIRKRTNQWPVFQNEIHFNNDFVKSSKLANQILEFI